MKLSRAAVFVVASVLRRRRELAGLVALDPQDRMHDQPRARPRSASSAITESTRNGMSSLTISITEIDFRCSPSEAFGELEADFRRAGLAGREKRPRLAGQRRELGGS